ncbi:hypothetical protein APS_0399 [Acetobacter pasteurianus subsp. pasteurianus LMG 1262 = NBRC 106471]|nr:hypothetical protein APS_0399 [Acetobacter pasteurianus subsp. pasteurianus LMG 1262 = NBRC 106471]
MEGGINRHCRVAAAITAFWRAAALLAARYKAHVPKQML